MEREVLTAARSEKVVASDHADTTSAATSGSSPWRMKSSFGLKLRAVHVNRPISATSFSVSSECSLRFRTRTACAFSMESSKKACLAYQLIRWHPGRPSRLTPSHMASKLVWRSWSLFRPQRADPDRCRTQPFSLAAELAAHPPAHIRRNRHDQQTFRFPGRAASYRSFSWCSEWRETGNKGRHHVYYR